MQAEPPKPHQIAGREHRSLQWQNIRMRTSEFSEDILPTAATYLETSSMVLSAVNMWTEFEVAMLWNRDTCITYGENIRPRCTHFRGKE